MSDERDVGDGAAAEERDVAAALEEALPHDDTPHRTPAEASRTGLAALDQHAHAATHDGSAGHSSGAVSTETPGEQHRGGPLPYQKR